MSKYEATVERKNEMYGHFPVPLFELKQDEDGNILSMNLEIADLNDFSSNEQIKSISIKENGYPLCTIDFS